MTTKNKVFTNEKGYVIVTLPSDKTEVTLRSPKGKDLKAIELAAQVDSSSIGTMMTIVSLLAVEPKLSIDDLDEMEAIDISALGEALTMFPVFSSMAK